MIIEITLVDKSNCKEFKLIYDGEILWLRKDEEEDMEINDGDLFLLLEKYWDENS